MLKVGDITSVKQFCQWLDAIKPTIADLRDHLGQAVLIRGSTRIILTAANLATCEASAPIVKACNGLLFDYNPDTNAYKLLAAPPPVLVRKQAIPAAAIDGEYAVYEINDGTQLTLYWYGTSWRLSTTNGYDVGDLYWRGSSTYMEHFINTMTKFSEFSLDKLNKRRSYTVGIRVKDFHPLLGDPEKCWFVRAFDLDAYEYTNRPPEEVKFLPQQTRLVVTSAADLAAFTEKNANAMTSYLAAIKRRGPIPALPHYGYVCKHRHGGVGSANLVVESTLYRAIRKLIYDIPWVDRQSLDHVTRVDYMPLRAYLNPCNRNVFVDLFPQYHYRFDQYSQWVDRLFARVVDALQLRKKVAAEYTDSPLGKLAAVMSKHISDHSKINVMNPEGGSIVMDFLTNPAYARLYLSCF